MESESQFPPPQQDPSVVMIEGHEGEHPPHKSVIKKVKDKAKKIKDTIKKHGHAHDHDHDHDRQGGVRRRQEGYVEEDEDDYDSEDDPELHGAPMYDSTVIRTTNPPMESNINVGNPKHTPAHEAENKIIAPAPVTEPDPHYITAQSKVTGPTGDGGKEAANVAPLVSQFDKMDIDKVFDKKPEPHVRFAPDSGVQEKVPTEPEQNPTHQSTIAEKITSATSVAAGAAVSAKNVVASKLGYGAGPQEEHSSVQAQELSSAGSVKEYLAEKLRPGEEDKALSEVITEVFTWKRERSVVEGSRVKESEEVAARLGPAPEKKREGEDALAAGAESSGQGVVDRLKDAVGAWLGKGTGLQTAQDSIEGTYMSDPISATNQVEKGEGASGRQRG